MLNGGNIKKATEQRKEREMRFKRETTEPYNRVLNNQFNDITLGLIDKYIANITPENPYGRLLSKRRPPRVGQAMRGIERNNAVDALFTRISESVVRETGSSVERARARREVEKKMQEILKD